MTSRSAFSRCDISTGNRRPNESHENAFPNVIDVTRFFFHVPRVRWYVYKCVRFVRRYIYRHSARTVKPNSNTKYTGILAASCSVYDFINDSRLCKTQELVCARDLISTRDPRRPGNTRKTPFLFSLRFHPTCLIYYYSKTNKYTFSYAITENRYSSFMQRFYCVHPVARWTTFT